MKKVKGTSANQKPNKPQSTFSNEVFCEKGLTKRVSGLASGKIFYDESFDQVDETIQKSFGL